MPDSLRRALFHFVVDLPEALKWQASCYLSGKISGIRHCAGVGPVLPVTSESSGL